MSQLKIFGYNKHYKPLIINIIVNEISVIELNYFIFRGIETFCMVQF